MALRKPLAAVLGLVVVLTAVWLLVRRPTPNPGSAVSGCGGGDPAGWQRWDAPDLNFSIAYPPGWRVHNADKALEISRNTQPSWSSLAEPGWSGPLIHVLHNLNRGQAATPLQEVIQQRDGWLQERPDLTTLQEPTPLGGAPEAVVAVYALDTDVVLLGAVALAGYDGAPGSVGLSAVVERDGLEGLRPIFDGILCSVRGRE